MGPADAEKESRPPAFHTLTHTRHFMGPDYRCSYYARWHVFVTQSPHRTGATSVNDVIGIRHLRGALCLTLSVPEKTGKCFLNAPSTTTVISGRKRREIMMYMRVLWNEMVLSIIIFSLKNNKNLSSHLQDRHTRYIIFAHLFSYLSTQ